MAQNDNFKMVDAGRAESEKYEPSEEVRGEFADASRLGSQGALINKLRDHHSQSPADSAGDIDAAWDRTHVGEEMPGGSSPTPDQDNVEEVGQAVGINYQDNEPLHSTDKIAERDQQRWELDPASSEDYQERMRGQD